MGFFCSDNSLTILAKLGYNVVRHPRANLAPLTLIGKQNGEFLQLGSIAMLINNAPGNPPSITKDQPGAGIQGQSSSSLDIGIGANLLGNIIGGMGGNLGVNTSYTDARKISFKYTDVTLDSVDPLEVGEYLKNGDVNADNLILEQYVLGNGELFVISTIAKSKKFSISYERKNSVGAKVDVPALQALASTNVKVSVDAAGSSTVSFEGKTPLSFAFQCLQVGVVDGQLSLTTVKAGAVAATAAADLKTPPPALGASGLIDLGA
jgi:hypothetical protein